MFLARSALIGVQS